MKNGFVCMLVSLMLSVMLMDSLACCQDVRPEQTTAPSAQAFSLEPHEHGVIFRVNQRRAAAGLPALEPCPTLMEGSRQWAEHMARRCSMYHAAGFRENIACGYATDDAVVNCWMNSSGHRANIMNPYIRFIGIGGCIINGRTYWCQRFR